MARKIKTTAEQSENTDEQPAFAKGEMEKYLFPVEVIKDLRFTDGDGRLYALDGGSINGQFELRIIG